MGIWRRVEDTWHSRKESKLKQSTKRYTKTAIILHWSIALLLVLVIGLAYLLDAFPDESQQFATVIGLHKSIGITILALSLLRLAWRFLNKPPQLPASTPAWQRWAAHAMMFLIYALTIATPLLGWAMSSADGHATSFFGMFNLPNLLGENENIAEQLEELHELFANVIIGLAGLHVLAALKHQFIDQDSLMDRIRLK